MGVSSVMDQIPKRIDRTAFYHVGTFDVSLSLLAAALLLGSVAIQVWG